jgi:hypothetical protein
MKLLPKQAFEETVVTTENADLFYINGYVIFPPNIKEVDSLAYKRYKQDIFYCYGEGVKILGEDAFF